MPLSNSWRGLWSKFLADPGKAMGGCCTNTSATHRLTDSFTDSLFKISLWCCHAQMDNNGASSHKTNYIDIFRDSKSLRDSKLLYCFKSYDGFAEWVDFAYWWSFTGKGLRLQPVQKACFPSSKTKKEHFWHLRWFFLFSSNLSNFDTNKNKK